MQEPDEDLERYLRTFKPRAVRSLEVRGYPETRWLQRLVVAAAVVLVGGVSFWYSQRQIAKPSNQVATQAVPFITVTPQARMNTPALTKLALDDSEAFEALLARESRTVLPGMQEEQSALKVLAKE
jgi:hypothetical protein